MKISEMEKAIKRIIREAKARQKRKSTTGGTEELHWKDVEISAKTILEQILCILIYDDIRKLKIKKV